TILSGTGDPGALTFDMAGNLYVGNDFPDADPSPGVVYVYASSTLTTIAAVGTFASKNVGNNIPVNVTGLAIAGADARNYTLVQPTLSASITPKPLSVTGLFGDNKTYDGTTSDTFYAIAPTLVGGVYAGDNVALSSAPTATL